MRRWALVLLPPALVAAGLTLAGGGCKKRRPLLPGMVATKDRTEGGEGGDLMSKLGRRPTRAEAARELGKRKIREAIPALKGYLRDEDPEVRLNCVWALGEMGEKKTIPDVRALLTDEEPAVRAAAAEALGKMPDKAAVLWLSAALRDQSAQVRLAGPQERLGRLGTPLCSVRFDRASPVESRTKLCGSRQEADTKRSDKRHRRFRPAPGPRQRMSRSSDAACVQGRMMVRGSLATLGFAAALATWLVPTSGAADGGPAARGDVVRFDFESRDLQGWENRAYPEW